MNETNHPSSLATCTIIQDFLGVKDGGIYEAVVKLKQQLDAVVAECVLAKAEVVCWAKECDRIAYRHTNQITDMHQLEAVKDLANLTPNVTAALAEVEAKAIEAFAGQQEEKLKAAALIGATHLESAHEFAALQARAFAVELREGWV